MHYHHLFSHLIISLTLTLEDLGFDLRLACDLKGMTQFLLW